MFQKTTAMCLRFVNVLFASEYKYPLTTYIDKCWAKINTKKLDSKCRRETGKVVFCSCYIEVGVKHRSSQKYSSTKSLYTPTIFLASNSWTFHSPQLWGIWTWESLVTPLKLPWKTETVNVSPIILQRLNSSTAGQRVCWRKDCVCTLLGVSDLYLTPSKLYCGVCCYKIKNLNSVNAIISPSHNMKHWQHREGMGKTSHQGIS